MICQHCGSNRRRNDKLTPREEEIKTLVCKGLTSKQIGVILFICEKSVKFHLTNIYRKLGVNGRYQLIAKKAG